MIKTIIIEDEAAIQKELKWLVSQQKEQFEICGVAPSVKEAVKLIQKVQPDLVLMDIQLTDGTAFDILEKLGHTNFQLIFITAYNQFAIKAIKAGAFDYLLKPIDETELNTALERVVKLHNRFNAETVQQQLHATKDFSASDVSDIDQVFFVPAVDHLQFVKMSDIAYCNSEGSFTQIHLITGKKITATKTLKYYEDLLPEQCFIRIHQSHIVNKKCVDKILKHGGLVIKSGEELPIASRRKDFVIEQMLQFRG